MFISLLLCGHNVVNTLKGYLHCLAKPKDVSRYCILALQSSADLTLLLEFSKSTNFKYAVNCM